jgi:hypothetical protein
LILGCWHHVCSVLASITILRIYRMPSKALNDANSAVSPLPSVGDPYWAEVASLSAYSAATTPDVSASATDERVLC